MLDALMSPQPVTVLLSGSHSATAEEMSGWEKEKCGSVTPRMACIHGLAGDMVPSDPEILSPPECSEDQDILPGCWGRCLSHHSYFG